MLPSAYCLSKYFILQAHEYVLKEKYYTLTFEHY